METPDSSIPPAEAGPPSEPPASSAPEKSSDLSPTRSTQTLRDVLSNPDRVIVRLVENIEIITYTQEGTTTVVVSPRRAIQLVHDLIRCTLEKTAP